MSVVFRSINNVPNILIKSFVKKCNLKFFNSYYISSGKIITVVMHQNNYQGTFSMFPHIEKNNNIEFNKIFKFTKSSVLNDIEIEKTEQLWTQIPLFLDHEISIKNNLPNQFHSITKILDEIKINELIIYNKE